MTESLSPNATISHYRILLRLGAGGMGEIYLAEDVRLGRKVALKLLPGELTKNEDRLIRFQQEARAASALNHPNLIIIYEIGLADSVHFIATEFIEGETLRQRMRRTRVRLSEALDIGIQVVSALAAAHHAGIVHRDIKPDNIMLRHDGFVKVLDFGLAKLTEPQTSSVNHEAPTMARVDTNPGVVMGTVHYMSPEQVRGLPVDARSDIFSFGIVLYEMIAGQAPFEGETTSDVIVSILEKEPFPLARYSRDIPEAIEWIVAKALRKDKEERYQTAKELQTDLKNLRQRLEFEAELERSRSEEPAIPAGVQYPKDIPAQITATPPKNHRAIPRWWLIVAGAIVLLLLSLFTLFHRKSSLVATPVLPKLSQITFAEGIEEYPAWSPDGSQLAYSGEVSGIRKIFIRNLQTGEQVQLTKGTYDDIQPTWSQDGQTILFVRSHQPNVKLEPGDVFGQYDGGNIWMIDIRTAKEMKVIENAFNPAYSPDGKRIAFDASWVGPRRIWIVDDQGHNPQQVTTDSSEEMRHVRPRWSPDGSKIVFQNIERTKFNIRVADLTSKKTLWVTKELFQDINPVWSHSGKFIYFSSYRSGGLNIWRVPVTSDGSPSGLPQQLTTGAGQDVELSISPDGKRIAFSILRQNADIWKLPVSPQTGKLTSEPQEVIATTREDSRGAWSPDGRWIAFNSDRTGDMNIWLFSLTDGSVRQLTKGPGGDFQPNWSPDGKWIVFFSSRSGNADIWAVEVASGNLRQLTKNASIDVNPFFSPDGTRIAYQSDQSGRLEVWLMNADGNEPRQLTTVGVSGHFLRWSQKGDSVIFRCPCGGKPQTLRASANGGEPQPFAEVAGGAHMSFSPDYSMIMDVVGHKTLWVSPLNSGKPQKVFEFKDPDVRIDYPVWSINGKWILFDRFRPQGGNVWIMEEFE